MTSRLLRLPLAALMLGGALSVSGCLGTTNRGMESVKQPVVGRADYVFDVAESGGRLAAGEGQRLAAWFDTIGLRYGDRIAIDARSTVPSPGVRDEVGAAVGRYGLLIGDTAPITAGEVEPGRVRVVVSRTTATVPDCPDWRGADLPDFSSSTTPNYGCASNRNIAQMVANPEDLIHGREPDASVDASASGKAVRLYRERTPSGQGGLQRQSTGAAGGGSN